MNSRRLGAEYEHLACERLESEGMQILETNYRVRIGEIDIIARDKDELVFVEVKYRKDTSCGGAEYAISYTKQQKIRRIAQWYLNEKHISPNAYCRFDAVLIDNGDINHIKNAW